MRQLGAAAGAWVEETFESIAPGTQLSSLAGLGVSFDFLDDGITYPSVQDKSFTGGHTTSGSHILLNDIDNTLPGRGPINLRPLVPGTWIQAVGYWNTGGDDNTVLRFFDADGLLIEEAMCIQDVVFNGIVTATPAYRVEIGRGSIGNGYFTLDDLQVTAVPEPATVCLLGLGGLLLRKRKSA